MCVTVCTVCCIALQCVAVRCSSVLQCVAVCCSVLQCAATVSCGALQCVDSRAGVCKAQRRVLQHVERIECVFYYSDA